MKLNEIHLRDPFIYAENERYYLYGLISSKWSKQEGFWRYEITTPVGAEIIIDSTSHQVSAGTYYYYSEIK